MVEYLQKPIDDDSTTFFPAGQHGHQRVRRGRNRAHESLGRDSVTALEDGGFSRRPGQTCIETDLDPSAPQQVLGEPGQVLGQFGENERARVEQGDTNFGRIDVPKITGSGTYEVIEFRDSFDARESSAGNHEGEQGAPQLGVRFDISFFEEVNDPVPLERCLLGTFHRYVYGLMRMPLKYSGLSVHRREDDCHLGRRSKLQRLRAHGVLCDLVCTPFSVQVFHPW